MSFPSVISLVTVLLLTPTATILAAVDDAAAADAALKDVRHLANLNTDFGLRMYKVVASNTAAGAANAAYGNIFFSPLSVSTAFAMLQLGANGSSRDELNKVFGYGNTFGGAEDDDTDDDVHGTFQALLRELSPQSGIYQLDIANRLFAAEQYEILASYSAATRKYYDAPTERLNFADETAESRRYINSWVENRTNDKIKEFIKPGVLNAGTVLVIVNAIYFKSNWYKEFDKELTTRHPFTNHLGEDVDVDMMTMTSQFKYAESDELNAQVLELFYDSDQASMVIILPSQPHTLADVTRELDVDALTDTLRALTSSRVRVKIPRFSLTQTVDLKPVLEHMGVRGIFGAADLSGISGGRDLYVTDAFHKAFIKVDETGTEAAAATGIIVGKTEATQTAEFVADRPFLFLIRHVKTESVLFIGRMGDPTKSDSSIDALTDTAATIMYSCGLVFVCMLISIIYMH